MSADPSDEGYDEDDWPHGYDADDDDDFDELGECGAFVDGGVYVCGAAGSEDCEFDCPFNRLLGTYPVVGLGGDVEVFDVEADDAEDDDD